MPDILTTRLTLDPANQIARLDAVENLITGTEYAVTGEHVPLGTRFVYKGRPDIALTKRPFGVRARHTPVNITISTIPDPLDVVTPLVATGYPYNTKDRLWASGLNNSFLPVTGGTITGALTITPPVGAIGGVILNAGNFHLSRKDYPWAYIARDSGLAGYRNVGIGADIIGGPSGTIGQLENLYLNSAATLCTGPLRVATSTLHQAWVAIENTALAPATSGWWRIYTGDAGAFNIHMNTASDGSFSSYVTALQITAGDYNARFQGGVNVNGPSVFSSSATFNGPVLFNGTFNVPGAANFNGNVTVSGNITVGGDYYGHTLHASGGINVAAGGVYIQSGGLSVIGNTNLSGALDVAGPVGLDSSLQVVGSTELSSLSVDHDLVVNGATTLGGHVTMNSNLDVAGSAGIVGSLTVTGPLSVSSIYDTGDLQVVGNARVQGSQLLVDHNLAVAGTGHISGALGVDGALNVGPGESGIAGNLTVGGNLGIIGNLSGTTIGATTVTATTVQTTNLVMGPNHQPVYHYHTDGGTLPAGMYVLYCPSAPSLMVEEALADPAGALRLGEMALMRRDEDGQIIMQKVGSFRDEQGRQILYIEEELDA